MKRIINRIFSDAYANHKAIGNNFVLLIMYRFAYPFAVALNKLRLTPNQITTLSTAFAFLAFIALIRDDGWVLFSIGWGTSVLLDFCDGTVARMADKVSKTAFRYDHMSDLFKISLIILGAGIRYNDTLVWVVAFSACFAFLYGDALNREVHLAINRSPSGENAVPFGQGERSGAGDRAAAWLSGYGTLYALVKNIRAALLTVNGHTLLLFFIFPFGAEIVVWGFAYLILIELRAIRSRIALLVSMRR
ncbi:MAG: CDP-alcohol phosphatidyltransferase family protein [Halothiobacillaceae bacterium]|nr:CDP-alcohol phosphatidyltransferase family protein [Halothiobacillaceae bacterium]